MASFSYDVPDDFIKQLGNLADIDRYAPLMIDGAIPILEQQVKVELSRHKVTGDLLKSIKTTKTKKTKAGVYSASVEPSGTDRKGVRNVEKMLYLEYGTSRQPATPVLTKAVKDSEKEVLGTMQAIFDKEMGK